MPSLRTLRRLAGLTQPQLAGRSGITQTAISMLELGKVAGPRATTTHRLARALRVTDAAVLAALHDSVRHRLIRQRRQVLRIRQRQAAGAKQSTA